MIEVGINNQMADDLDIVEQYSKKQLIIDDFIRLADMANNGKTKAVAHIVKQLVEGTNISLLRFFERYNANIEILKTYQYCFIPLELSSIRRFVVSIGKGSLLTFDETDECKPVFSSKLHRELILPSVEIDTYCHTLSTIECALADVDYYLNRAKKGENNFPIYLLFKDKLEFYDSLFFFDYEEMLDCENVVLALEGFAVNLTGEYIPKTDLSILTRSNVYFTRVSSGLGNQALYYVWGKLLEETMQTTVIYDDLPLVNYKTFPRCFPKLACENDRRKFLSVLLNKKMIQRFLSKYVTIPWLQGVDLESCFALSSLGFELKPILTLHNLRLLLASRPDYMKNAYIADSMLEAMRFSFPIPYNSIMWLKGVRFPLNMDFKVMKSAFEKYIIFPKLDDESYCASIANKMQRCDAVAVHIRRGDRVGMSTTANAGDYRAYLQKISTISEYSDKEFFIFSDDLTWCRDNADEIGLSYCGNKITFVAANAHEPFWDLYLISLAKVIVTLSDSSFGAVAFLCSESVEVYFGGGSYDYQSKGWMNKYLA